MVEIDVEQQVLDAYSTAAKACIAKLKCVFRQIGKPPDQSKAQVLEASEEALAVWSRAVDAAEGERQAIKVLIQQSSAEINAIRTELDDGTEAQPTEAEVSSSGEGEATLLRSLESLQSTLQLWRTRRAARMQAYEALMAVHISLKRQLGLPHVAISGVDISTGALEYLQMENGKLEDDKGRRLSRAEEQLDCLRAICRELGEDSAAAAAEVHPALRTLSAEKESAEMLGVVYRLTGSASLAAVDADLDLGDGCFDRLAAKIGEMGRLKTEREAQSRDVLEMLGSLWMALDIPEDAPERSMVHKMLNTERPQRLHKRTLDKCMSEVNRLEGCKAQAMRDLALSKARELEQLCISTRISPPHTGPLLAELDKPGQMTQVLTKLVRLVAEVQVMVAKRGPILGQVAELLAAQADSAWLRAYNSDGDRYKGRDASRNMQRAIKAGKLRERLGPMMEGLMAALNDWEVDEGGPFLYDEQVLQDTMLKGVEAELELLTVEKQPKPKSAAGTTAAAAGGKPPVGRAGSVAGATLRGPPTGAGVARPTTSQHSDSRPMLTPRNVGDTYRRMSLAPASSRDSGVYRGSAAPQTAGKASGGGMMVRSGDFALGSLRAAALGPESSSTSVSMAPPAMTPPMRYQNATASSPMRTGAATAASPMRTGGGGAPGTAGGNSVGSVKNSAQDLFKRYLGDADGSKATPGTTPGGGLAAASPKPTAKLSFSAAFHSAMGEEDDGADDVVRAKCDTPKSTATSRVALQLQLAGAAAAACKSPQQGQAPSNALLSPKPSRIPRLRL